MRERGFSGRVAVLALLVSAPSHAGDTPSWREARSPHFRLFATWSEDELRATAARLERFRTAVVTDCCGGQELDAAPVTLVILPRAQPLEKAWGPRTWGRVLTRPERTVITYGRPLQWVLTPSPLGPERTVLIARAILAGAGGPAKQWKPWQLRAYAAYVGTAEAAPEVGMVLVGGVNQPTLQAALNGPAPDQELLDRWDGTDRWIGEEADAVLEGMGYVVLAADRGKLDRRQGVVRFLGELGRSRHPVRAPEVAPLGQVRAAPEAELQALLAGAGVTP
jgi:hypothetical protein